MDNKYKVVRTEEGVWKMVYEPTYQRRLSQLPTLNRWGLQLSAWWAYRALRRNLKRWRQDQLTMNRRNLKAIKREEMGKQSLLWRMLGITRNRRVA